jgi:hypothetical protein
MSSNEEKYGVLLLRLQAACNIVALVTFTGFSLKSLDDFLLNILISHKD